MQEIIHITECIQLFTNCQFILIYSFLVTTTESCTSHSAPAFCDYIQLETNFT